MLLMKKCDKEELIVFLEKEMSRKSCCKLQYCYNMLTTTLWIMLGQLYFVDLFGVFEFNLE